MENYRIAVVTINIRAWLGAVKLSWKQTFETACLLVSSYCDRSRIPFCCSPSGWQLLYRKEKFSVCSEPTPLLIVRMSPQLTFRVTDSSRSVPQTVYSPQQLPQANVVYVVSNISSGSVSYRMQWCSCISTETDCVPVRSGNLLSFSWYSSYLWTNAGVVHWNRPRSLFPYWRNDFHVQRVTMDGEMRWFYQSWPYPIKRCIISGNENSVVK
jgi:hypothetical protein